MTYEYLCTACGHAWEAEQSISEKALTTCPQCKTENAKRQVSGGAGFILKGGGWYADLYGSAPKKSGGDTASEGAKTGDKGDSGAKKESSGEGAAKKTETATAGASATGAGSTGSGSTGSKPPGASAA